MMVTWWIVAFLPSGSAGSSKLWVIKAPSREPAVCCCVVVATAYTNRGGRPGPPKCGF